MSVEQLEREVLDIIYKNVFGMSCDEIITEAKRRAGDKWDYMGWGDEDEAAKDWFSLEALQTLNLITHKLSRKQANIKGQLSAPTVRAIAKYVSAPHKVSNIWD